MALHIGDDAPNFTLPSTAGNNFNLAQDLKDTACILYFYPKDFTPGCNAEACEFRDHFENFREVDIPVFGISTDSIPTHLKFKAKYGLPFELLSDQDGKVTKAYDAIIPILKLAKRTTYLLGKDHKIKAVYNEMFGARNHIKAMLDEVNQ
jgi:peroxiredoxin Q/BCP